MPYIELERFLKRIDSYLYSPRAAYAFAELIDNSLAATVENEGDRIIELSLVSWAWYYLNILKDES